MTAWADHGEGGNGEPLAIVLGPAAPDRTPPPTTSRPPGSRWRSWATAAVCEPSGDGGRILHGLSKLAAAGGDPDRAITPGLQASAIFRDIETPLEEVQVLGVLSNAYTALGEHNAAEDIRVRMLDLRAGFTGFK